MVPWKDWYFYSLLATNLHCIIWWHVYESGDYQPYLQPVSDETWAQIVQ